MGHDDLLAYWEDQLRRDGMPAHVGEDAERHGHAWQRVESLDTYPDLVEKGRAWAVWDCYDLDEGDDSPTAPDLALPEAIQAIAEKRLRDETLTAAERQCLHRYRQGANTGHPGRPRKR